MHPTLATSERVVKKVSRACNTCRLKRKKCDGLDPCAFCVDNKLECLYSKEPRRRGPPSGYLRYTETRVAILEILLGLYLSKLPKKEEDADVLFDPFLDIAKTLQTEAKTCTQDVWDAHKTLWTRCPSAKVVEELVVSFAPFTPRSAQEAPAKTLLPPPPTSTASSATHDRHSVSKEGTRKSEKIRHSAPQISFAQTHRPESFDRTGSHDHLTDTGSPASVRAQGITPEVVAIEERDGWQDCGPADGHQAGPHLEPASESVRLTYPSHRAQPFEQNIVQLHTTDPVQLRDTADIEMALGLGGAQEYTGSYWRTVDLAMPEPETYTPVPITPANSMPLSRSQLDLPPSHILSRLLDVYYQHSHPSYPLLPSRNTLDAILLSPGGKSEPLSTMMLSICAYSGRLSPTTHPSSDSMTGTGGLAGKIAADLWYEQARTALSALLKKESSLELVQASLLLALRDYGKGNESQAWVLVGLAVRMAQDLQLHDDLAENAALQTPPEETLLRRNVWGVCIVLDLLLSLQMGRPPIYSDPLKGSLVVASRSRPPDVDVNPSPPFTYAVSLCRVISMINFHLYLGYPSPAAQTPPDKLSHLRTELDMWHRTLPMQYRISIGHQPRRDVLEINMLYHVAIILLYRPISREQLNQQATDIFLEAASTFNVLLEKYRQSQAIAQSNPPSNVPVLSHTNPNMIYLIYTVAIAHLSGYKLRQVQQANANAPATVSSTSALQTQLHLLKCLEALASIGYTWELARRCWKALDTFMEMENLKPRSGEDLDENGSLTLGKRKRETEEPQRRPWPMGGRLDSPTVVSGAHGSPIKPQHPPQQFPVSLSSPVPGLGTMMNSPSMPNQFASGYPQMPQHNPPPNVGTSEWNGNNNVPYTSSETAFPSFDPSLFSTRWMPDASQGASGDWDSSWDETAWSQNYIGGMGLF
ncbi:hypothetical protein P691DRAFT_809349 [Macrolepiota fuliginosa MF-IS2]|uniref:Zn(2)-C6 fungal-type domain-containing protein n=1 Tax=Macrolepiota fuliginosa MF-IS2 TaxID=1400762 RepID=A0A9P5XKG2_9AGAR|nr:hypothetical protein P691DRAFT_809349 [Macrolepiota fuliginosa MF-IS2]